jgi:hypothetical protein
MRTKPRKNGREELRRTLDNLNVLEINALRELAILLGHLQQKLENPSTQQQGDEHHDHRPTHRTAQRHPTR